MHILEDYSGFEGRDSYGDTKVIAFYTSKFGQFRIGNNTMYFN